MDEGEREPDGPDGQVLSAEQIARMRAAFRVFEDFVDIPVDHRIEEVARDGDPERQIVLYERVAEAHAAYCSGRALTRDAKLEAYLVLVGRTRFSHDDVLASTMLEALTNEQAAELLAGYRWPHVPYED